MKTNFKTLPILTLLIAATLVAIAVVIATARTTHAQSPSSNSCATITSFATSSSAKLNAQISDIKSAYQFDKQQLENGWIFEDQMATATQTVATDGFTAKMSELSGTFTKQVLTAVEKRNTGTVDAKTAYRQDILASLKKQNDTVVASASKLQESVKSSVNTAINNCNDPKAKSTLRTAINNAQNTYSKERVDAINAAVERSIKLYAEQLKKVHASNGSLIQKIQDLLRAILSQSPSPTTTATPSTTPSPSSTPTTSPSSSPSPSPSPSPTTTATPSTTPSPTPSSSPSPSTPPATSGDVKLTATATYTKHANLQYGSGTNAKTTLDLYLPNQNDVKPLIVYIHGGGWNSGSKDEYCYPSTKFGATSTTATFMNRGFAVACINYRLSTEAPFPAQLEDVKSAIRFLRANASKYKLGPNIGVWGGSAGGHLAAMAGTTGSVAGLDKGANLQLSSRVQAVVDDFGPTDLTAWATTPGYESNQARYSMVGRLLGGEVLSVPDKARAANPATYVTADDPPFDFLHGDKDPIVPINQSQLLHQALQKAKVKSTLTIVPSADHPPKQSYSISRLDDVARFFAANIVKGSTTVPTPSTSPSPVPTTTPAPPPSTGGIPVGPRLVFSGNYDTGNLTQWAHIHTRDRVDAPGNYCTYSICVRDGGQGHTTAARFEVRDGDVPNFGGGERAEVRAGSWEPTNTGGYAKEGDERWYEFSIKFDEPWVNPRNGSNSWFAVYQWFSDGGVKDGPPLALLVTPNNELQIGGAGPLASYRKTIGPILPGQWVNYVMHVKFSQNASTGFVEAWQNGKLTVAKHARPTLESGKPTAYLKQGIYRNVESSGTHVVWHDGLRVTAP